MGNRYLNAASISSRFVSLGNDARMIHDEMWKQTMKLKTLVMLSKRVKEGILLDDIFMC